VSVQGAISLVTNLPAVRAALQALPRDQVPFAVALSLTRLSVRVRDAARQQLQANFDVRSRWVVQRLSMDLTRKGEWPKPTSKVGEEYSPFELHEKGGPKLPGVGYAFVFVPTRFVRAQRDGQGKIPVALRPQSLISRGLVRTAELPGLGLVLLLNERVAARANGRRRRGATRINEAGFTPSGNQRALYLLRPTVQIKPKFGLFELGERVVKNQYAKVFVTAMDDAFKTRRS
jgi:hypothetical protein